MNAETLLPIALSAAVPLHIQELKRRPWDEITRIAHESADIVASKGDVLQFGGGKKGSTAAAFNALARGLAACAFAPGGITFLGLHFEAQYVE